MTLGLTCRAVLLACVGVLLGTGGATGQEFKPRLAYVAQPSNPFHTGMQKFADDVKARSNGRIEVQLFHSSQLGGERDYIEGMQLGSMDMAATSTGALTAFEPRIALFSLPFIFSSPEHYDKVVDGPIGKEMSQRVLAKGVRVLGYTDMGARYIMNSQRPVKSPADLRGLKMRVIQDPVPVETYSAMGARAIPMARPEVYSALKQGVLDGLDNGLAFYESMGDFEVAKYLTLGVQIFQTPGALMVSERFFQKLPKDMQDALIQAGTNALSEQRKLFRQGDSTILKRLQDKGVVVQTADPIPFQALVSPVWDKFQDRVGGRAAIDAVVNTK